MKVMRDFGLVLFVFALVACGSDNDSRPRNSVIQPAAHPANSAALNNCPNFSQGNFYNPYYNNFNSFNNFNRIASPCYWGGGNNNPYAYQPYSSYFNRGYYAYQRGGFVHVFVGGRWVTSYPARTWTNTYPGCTIGIHCNWNTNRIFYGQFPYYPRVWW